MGKYPPSLRRKRRGGEPARLSPLLQVSIGWSPYRGCFSSVDPFRKRAVCASLDVGGPMAQTPELGGEGPFLCRTECARTARTQVSYFGHSCTFPVQKGGPRASEQLRQSVDGLASAPEGRPGPHRTDSAVLSTHNPRRNRFAWECWAGDVSVCPFGRGSTRDGSAPLFMGLQRVHCGVMGGTQASRLREPQLCVEAGWSQLLDRVTIRIPSCVACGHPARSRPRKLCIALYERID